MRSSHKANGFTGPVTEETLRRWLVGYLADQMKVDESEVDPEREFEAYGLDSRVGLQLSGKLEKILERRLSPGLVYQHHSINALIAHLMRSEVER
ncbi:acyl carrier protein [Lentzea sp. NPDC004782]|uniref:acyl carrier protein n=1 Tax=Lentzea sp. NPDC004782 TaxID=3154458 RepID=UPI0033B31773